MTVKGCLFGEQAKGDMTNGDASFAHLLNEFPNYAHHIAFPHGAGPFDSGGAPWNGTYVFNSGNLVLDLLHNFFLENGARTHKPRVRPTRLIVVHEQEGRIRRL